MSKLKFVKVGDINITYPFLEVYYDEKINPFMDIGVNNEKQLEFLFYVADDQTKLSAEEMEEIMNIAKNFLIEVLRDEDEFNEWESSSHPNS